MNTVPLPPLSIMSRPWSKNWPKKVNQLFDGADRPLSGVTLLMKALGWRPGMPWLLDEKSAGVARLPPTTSSAVPKMPSGPAVVVFW